MNSKRQLRIVAEDLPDLRPLTEEEMALVSFGKSLLAELTSAVESLSIWVRLDFSPLIPLPFKLVSPLMEFSRLARSVQ